MTTQETETVVVPFISQEVQDFYISTLVKAVKTHAGADRNLVGSLIASAYSLGRVVTDDDWTAHLAKNVRKGIAAKVSPDSVKVYVSHAKLVTIAVTGRPEINEALPVGKHWADQLTTKRKLEGVNAYVKRVGALLKVATRNEMGHLILPEGYSLMGELTASPEAETPKADETATGSAGQSADAEGGLNVDPATAKADALEAAAIVLMGSPKAAKALLDLIADKAGKDALAKLMREHATARAVAQAKEAADAKAGETLTNANV